MPRGDGKQRGAPRGPKSKTGPAAPTRERCERCGRKRRGANHDGHCK
jgi:hypothetical protein